MAGLEFLQRDHERPQLEAVEVQPRLSGDLGMLEMIKTQNICQGVQLS